MPGFEWETQKGKANTLSLHRLIITQNNHLIIKQENHGIIAQNNHLIIVQNNL